MGVVIKRETAVLSVVLTFGGGGVHTLTPNVAQRWLQMKIRVLTPLCSPPNIRIGGKKCFFSHLYDGWGGAHPYTPSVPVDFCNFTKLKTGNFVLQSRFKCSPQENRPSARCCAGAASASSPKLLTSPEYPSFLTRFSPLTAMSSKKQLAKRVGALEGSLATVSSKQDLILASLARLTSPPTDPAPSTGATAAGASRRAGPTTDSTPATMTPACRAARKDLATKLFNKYQFPYLRKAMWNRIAHRITVSARAEIRSAMNYRKDLDHEERVDYLREHFGPEAWDEYPEWLRTWWLTFAVDLQGVGSATEKAVALMDKEKDKHLINELKEAQRYKTHRATMRHVIRSVGGKRQVTAYLHDPEDWTDYKAEQEAESDDDDDSSDLDSPSPPRTRRRPVTCRHRLPLRPHRLPLLPCPCLPSGP